MPLSIVILAAGQGKRMNSDLPKVLQPLAGEPLLRHVIRTARTLDPTHLYIVYGHAGAQVQQAFAGEADLEWVPQAQQLGTGHAVMQAMGLIPDDHQVLVLYGDVPLIRTTCLRELLGAAAGTLALLTVNLNEATGYGRIVRDAAGGVTAIVEQQDATPDQLRIREANSGMLAAPAGRLRAWLLDIGSNNANREFYLTDVVLNAVKAGDPVMAIPAPSALDVLGVNDKRQLAQAEAGYRSLRCEELMLAGATLVDPLRVDVRGVVTIERDVFIDVNAVLIGRVHLGARVKIGPNCLIRNAKIGADTEILANCLIEDAVVADHCRIGPFARLRPDTVLDHGVHIGNFVEVKNARVGAGSKANHLSYVGDATIGSAVNLGAGTITCNYDGANKWPTVIEDGAFIGSGSMLVAPVRIGAGATIGAGSTITQSAPGDKLTLARAPQATVDGWSRQAKLSEAARESVTDEAMRAPHSGGVGKA
jgi:bifunctional UDP-N-acetylglucosamine pyrophosphorylase/glucosamine-1-phosphate N-acetyltransferase